MQAIDIEMLDDIAPCLLAAKACMKCLHMILSDDMQLVNDHDKHVPSSAMNA